MLQPRLENEHFNSLPNLLTSERSRTGFITTDRPDSSQLVDLHVYIIPKNVWKDVQHLAENEAMDEAMSAGFVHVSPNMKICDLRQSIAQLCGTESFFPRDFIFLRSVGRCLTRVKPRQETELKVKNYRPPQTFAPEIYLLEGRHEDYAHIPCASPALSSSSYMFGNRNRNHSDHDDDRLSPTRPTKSFHRRPMRGGKHYLPAVNAQDSLSQYPSSGRQSWTKLTQIGSDPEESSTNISHVTSIVSRELSKLKEEQERLRQRQAELERMRRAAEDKKAQSEREEEERRRQQQALTGREDEERRHRQEKAEAERRRLEQEKAEAARRRLEQEKAEAARRRIEQEAAATKIQASYRGFKDRQAFRERKRRLDPVLEVEKESQASFKNQSIHRRSLLIPTPIGSSVSQILTRSSSIGSTSYPDSSNTTQPETSRSKHESTESIDSNSSSLLSMKNQRRKNKSNLSAHSKTQETVDTEPFTIDSPRHSSNTRKLPHDNENNRSQTNNKLPKSSRKSFRRPTPEIDPEKRKIDDEIELERREAEAKRRRQLEEEEQKRKARELEDQRRRELAKRQREDPDTLRARLQELRARRVDLEKIREEVIKHLKNIHNRITLRRKEARDMWKKKYFIEKKKTPTLEERVLLLKTELDQIHKRTIQTIDGEAKHATQVGYTKEADVGNLIVQVTRTHHDIQDIRHQVEQAKLRLTTDVKLRNQAENECRSLRHELNQAKMNLNHIKTRV
ncbi:unnamed protein product [Rotaria socialis]|uniref:Spermatogenesis-associated protein 1 C-terminal domain-containing protein n=1 Tax=Rotaria socialis TaxID=392032 RepID=A0A818DZC6_9BILA|nr:unnamed protein product [Rotaria socialis]CAF3454467.1 unnamed protein product [Rotaria socialis]CAF3645315.1 unnamed protein product [Rotaria socialis]